MCTYVISVTAMANTFLEGCCQVQFFFLFGDRCNVDLFDLCVKKKRKRKIWFATRNHLFRGVM